MDNFSPNSIRLWEGKMKLHQGHAEYNEKQWLHAPGIFSTKSRRRLWDIYQLEATLDTPQYPLRDRRPSENGRYLFWTGSDLYKDKAVFQTSVWGWARAARRNMGLDLFWWGHQILKRPEGWNDMNITDHDDNTERLTRWDKIQYHKSKEKFPDDWEHQHAWGYTKQEFLEPFEDLRQWRNEEVEKERLLKNSGKIDRHEKLSDKYLRWGLHSVIFAEEASIRGGTVHLVVQEDNPMENWAGGKGHWALIEVPILTAERSNVQSIVWHPWYKQAGCMEEGQQVWKKGDGQVGEEWNYEWHPELDSKA